MAIAIMKRLTILCEPPKVEALLENLQEVKETQITSFKSLSEEDREFFKDQEDLTEHRLSEEMALRQLRASIDFLQSYVPKKHWRTNFEARPVYTLQQLEAEVQSFNIQGLLDNTEEQRNELSHIQKSLQSLEEQETFLRQWHSLDINPKTAQNLRHFNVRYGTIPIEQQLNLENALTRWGKDYYIDAIFYSKESIGYVIVTEKTQNNEMSQLLRQYQWSTLIYSYDEPPKVALEENLAERETLVKRDLEIRQQLKEASKTLNAFLLAEENLANRIERQKAQEDILQSQHITVVQAWLEDTQVESVIESIQLTLGEEALAVFVDDAEPEEIEANEVPTKLKNNWLARPFESLTLQYGVPTYQSVDPTPYYTIFQILFFGLMSADVGYGLLLFIATFIAGKMTTLSESMKQSLKMFNYNSVGTILVGLFFGSFFGYDMPFRVMSMSDNVIQIMIFSVAIGLVHMMVGYMLKARLALKDKDYGSFYLDALQWMLMILGGVLIAANMIINIPIIQTIGLVLLLGNIIGMFVANIIISPNKLVGVGKGLFGLIDVAGLVGDIVSYTRLTALGVAGANIAMAFNLIVGLLPPIAQFTVGLLLFVALHALNIFITYLGAYVHSMRLQFVEFFGKFYESGGTLFTPLKPLEKNIHIRKDN